MSRVLQRDAMDRFHEINAFVAVVEAAGFSAAARRLGESQSAISKAIGALERRLGVALLNRSTRSVTVTDAGQRYYDRTKPLLDDIEDADNDVTSSRLKDSGIVRIAVASTFGRLHVLPLLPGLLERNPGLQLDVVLSDAIRDFVEDRIDLAIRLGASKTLDGVVRRVASTPLVCVGSRQYFDKRGIPKTPAELVDHNCLVYSGLAESSNWPFAGPEGRISVRVRGNLSSNSVETIRTAVLGGVGIGLFSKVSLADELRHPDVMTVLDDYIGDARAISLIWPKRRFVPTRVRRATDFLAKALAERISGY